MIMIRSIFVAIVVLNSGVSWAVDWNSCYRDLKEVRDVSREALASTITLHQLYDRYDDEKFKLDSCISLGGDCQYLRLSVNELSIEYGKKKIRFNGMLQSIDKATFSMKETCGFQYGAKAGE
jgi:hypothetical protein